MEGHKRQYEVLNHHNPNAETGQLWDIEVHATPEELQTFADTGYLVREGLFQDENRAAGESRGCCPHPR